MNIGNILRQRRKLLGKTLEDVAFAANTDAGNLSRIERDEQRPSLDLLEAIAQALDTQMSALYKNAEMQQAASTEEPDCNYIALPEPIDPQLLTLIKHYHSLSEEGQAVALNLLASLKKTHAAK